MTTRREPADLSGANLCKAAIWWFGPLRCEDEDQSQMVEGRLEGRSTRQEDLLHPICRSYHGHLAQSECDSVWSNNVCFFLRRIPKLTLMGLVKLSWSWQLAPGS